jgi:DNA mismatch repair protein MLH1
MLREYFSIDISSDGTLDCLPELVEGYIPPLVALPLFLLRLGVECVWDNEQRCFETVSVELANFFQVQPGMYLSNDDTPPTLSPSPPASQSQSSTSSATPPPTPLSQPSNSSQQQSKVSTQPSLRWLIQHVLLPPMRQPPPSSSAPCSSGGFTPPRRLASDGTVTQVACLENLYKIFERC